MTQLPISRRVPFLGVLLAFSLCLSYLEMLIPLDFTIPGIKLGLSNFPVLICTILFGPIETLILAAMKAVISGMLFGNMVSVVYSLSGAILSALVMLVISKIKGIHVITVSVFGGTFHNIGQFGAAYLLIGSGGLFYYLPFLLAGGVFMGFLLGLAAVPSLPYIKRIIYSGKYEV